MIAAVAGLQGIMSGAIAQILFEPSGSATRRWLARLPYTRTMITVGVTFAIGVALCINFVREFLEAGNAVLDTMVRDNHLAVLGLTLMILSFTVFIGTLLIHAVAARTLTGSPDADAR